MENNRMHSVNLIMILLISLLFIQCSSSYENLDKSKKEIAFYYESGEYSKDLKKILNEAYDDIAGKKLNNNSTVVFDVDETTLSNYPHLKDVGFGYVPELWYKWVNSAKAKAIPEVKDFYDKLVNRGVKIIFLTGRRSSSYDATIKNLKDVGYNTFDTLIVKSDNYKNAPAANYKRIERTVLTELGYEIIASVGDQKSDMQGEYTGIKVKVPNYLYAID